MDESQQPKSTWWQTLPGVLTAAAATATAIAGLVGVLHQAGLFGGGDEKKPTAVKEVITSPKANSETRPTGQLCSARAGYPLGRWEITTKSDSTAGFSNFVTFTRPKGGTWFPFTGSGSFEASAAPTPGAEVILKLSLDSGGDYQSTNKLVVSPDGCHMVGTANDTQEHRAEVKYTWNDGS